MITDTIKNAQENMIQSIQFINANFNSEYKCCTISTIYNDIYTLYFLRFSWNALASMGLYISNIFSTLFKEIFMFKLKHIQTVQLIWNSEIMSTG